MAPIPRTLVLGIGNPLRRDDAAGWLLALRVEALAIPGVEVRCLQQLSVELAETWQRYDRVLIADAALSEQVRLEPLDPAAPDPGAHSHALPPAAVLNLARTLFGRTPEVWICAIPAIDFGFGMDPSPAVQTALDTALSRIRDWLQS